MSREGALDDIETDDIMLQAPQGADQSLAEMTGASRNQDFHDRAIRSNK
jgi:hypothetical protein